MGKIVQEIKRNQYVYGLMENFNWKVKKKKNKKGSLSALVSFDSVRDFLGEERQSMESRDFRFRMGSLRNSLLMASYFSVK